MNLELSLVLPLGLASLVGSAQAQVFVDGTIAGDSYGPARSVQAVQTQFGDNFSELDAGYATTNSGRMYIALTGNIEANFNKIELFIDSRAGGENVFSGIPGNDGTGSMTGLTFDSGFEADYHLILRRGFSQFDLDIAELGTPNFSSYIDVFGGLLEGSGVTGIGPANASPIEVAYDGSNVAGVIGGCDPADLVAAEAVLTGLELGIALSDLGNPVGEVRILAFVNNSNHDFASNQFLGSLGAPQCNLGGDGLGNFTGVLNFDLGTFSGDQFFVFTAGDLPSDDFSYADGPLVGNGGWNNHSGTSGDMLVSGGQVVVQHGVPSEDANIPFAPVAGAIYYGIDFSVDDLGHPYVGTDNEYFAHFRTGFNFSARLDVVPAPGGGDFSVGIASDDSTADAIWPADLTYGTTYRAIVRYDQVTNQAQLWIDASVDTDPSIMGDDQADPGDTVDSFALRQSDSDENETLRVDNLIVGTSFDSVTGGAGCTSNDDCDCATPILDGVTPFSTLGATTDGPLDANCQFDGQTYNDIWFIYEATCTGDLEVSTCGTVDYDSDLVVYDGTDCNNLTTLGCNDDFSGCAAFSSLVTVPVVSGNSYLIRVGGFLDGDVGSGDLSVTCTAAGLPNDNCADSIPISDGVTPFSTLGATTDGPVDANCMFDGQTYHDIWFTYVALCSGELEVSTCGTADYDTDLVVYDGTDCDNLVTLGCNDDALGCANFSSLVTVPVVGGNSYLIRVGGWQDGDFGTGDLTVTGPSPGGTNYCKGALNGDGQNGSMSMSGSVSVAANDLVLVASELTDSSFAGLFVMGDTQAMVPFASGFLCIDLGGTFIRLNPIINGGGDVISRAVDNTAAPANVITPGSTWNFQYWYRDDPAFGTNLTDGIGICFAP